jgi:hypothetical protein
MKGFSKCCDASIKDGFCFDCGEHAEPYKFDCEECQDTGEVSSPYRDSDGNWSDTDTRKCECKY